MLSKNLCIAVLASFCWLGSVSHSCAEPNAEGSAGEYSVYHIGNSLTGDLFSQFAKMAIPYEKTQGKTFRWGAHARPASSLSFIYANPTANQSGSTMAENSPRHFWHGQGDEAFMPWSTALKENHWDAVTLQPWEDGLATLKSETEAILGLIAAIKARPDNSATRVYLYCPWTISRYGELDSYRNAFLAPFPNQPDQVTTPCRDFFRHLADTVRKNDPNVAMIPAGEVLLALDEKMQAGKFEHFSSIQQLHRDIIHLNDLGKYVAAWTAYAVIFKSSPLGLPVGDIEKGTADPPFQNVKEISPADLQLMQQTVWEVVTSADLRDYTRIVQDERR